MARRRISSWRARAVRIVPGYLSHSLVEPSTSVKRKVTVPVGSRVLASPPPFARTQYIVHPVGGSNASTERTRAVMGQHAPRAEAVTGFSVGGGLVGNTRGLAWECDLNAPETRRGPPY